MKNLVGLTAEAPVDGQEPNTFPALPEKFPPLQQGPNAISTWICSHFHQTDHAISTRIHREVEILPPPPKGMLDGCKDKVSTPPAPQEAVKGKFHFAGLNFVSE